MSQENARRQQLEIDILQEAVDTVEKYSLHQRSALVVWGRGWHQGVIGIGFAPGRTIL